MNNDLQYPRRRLSPRELGSVDTDYKEVTKYGAYIQATEDAPDSELDLRDTIEEAKKAVREHNDRWRGDEEPWHLVRVSITLDRPDSVRCMCISLIGDDADA